MRAGPAEEAGDGAGLGGGGGGGGVNPNPRLCPPFRPRWEGAKGEVGTAVAAVELGGLAPSSWSSSRRRARAPCAAAAAALLASLWFPFSEF